MQRLASADFATVGRSARFVGWSIHLNLVSTTEPNPSSTPPPAPAPRSAGDKLAGCYSLTGRLDLGAEAEVWLASDEVLGKDVSLHFIPEAVRKDAKALQELRVDIKRNRQLIHPNILRIYDLVEEPEWVAISMDAFEGESFAQAMLASAGKKRPPEEIKGLVDQLTSTLEEAHKINVLHGGLAPKNVFVAPTGKLLVSSFGISRTVREAEMRAGGGENPEVAYQSPQSFEGAAPTRADDIYSLGAVLYALVSGKAPFTGADVAKQVQAGISPEALSVLQNEELGLPVSWRETIAACLSKDPGARPQSAAEVATRLAGSDPEQVQVIAPVPAESKVAATPESAPSSPEAVPIVAPTVESVAPSDSMPKAASEPKPLSLDSEPAGSPSEPITLPSGAAPSEKSEKAEKAEKIEAIVPPTKSAPPAKAVEPATPKARQDYELSKPAQGAKSPGSPGPGELSPRLYPEESRFPVRGLAAAAAAIVVIALIYHFAGSKKQAASQAAAAPEPEKAELRALSQPTPAATPAIVNADKAKPQPATPAPAAAAPSNAVPKAVAERTATLDKAQRDAQDAEQAHAELLKQQQLAETSLAEIQKSVDEKTKAMAPLKKVADELAAQRKKLEDDRKAAEAAAAEAQRVAAEKARLAEESAKMLAELEKKSAETLAAPQQAEAQLAGL